MKYLLIFIFYVLQGSPEGERPENFIQSGNELYKAGRLKEAIDNYNKALNTQHHFVALVNKGNALYKQGNYKAALQCYEAAALPADSDKMLRATACYNAGVIHSRQGNLPDAIAAFKASLRLNWQDTNTRENLQKALIAQQLNLPSQQPQNNTPAPATMTKSKAQQQLDKLEEKEKNTQKKVSQQKTQYSGSVGKDW